jgi:hypothetical protein
MTRLARSASLLVAFSLLISAATAHAECAWVLWSQQRTWKMPPPATDAWDIVDTFETKAACELKRASLHEPASQHGDRTFTMTQYICYPDTVDPRGPRGGRG